jgi:hypothetical protein
MPKRNAAHQKLLIYHVKPNTNRTTKLFTPPLPTPDLLETWGHSLPIIDPSQIFWLLLQNPNGLYLTYNYLYFQHDLDVCKDFGSAVMCLPETNVN